MYAIVLVVPSYTSYNKYSQRPFLPELGHFTIKIGFIIYNFKETETSLRSMRDTLLPIT